MISFNETYIIKYNTHSRFHFEDVFKLEELAGLSFFSVGLIFILWQCYCLVSSLPPVQ